MITKWGFGRRRFFPVSDSLELFLPIIPWTVSNALDSHGPMSGYYRRPTGRLSLPNRFAMTGIENPNLGGMRITGLDAGRTPSADSAGSYFCDGGGLRALTQGLV